MPTRPLPTKLRNEPLVDAVFEVRFSSTVPASSILPGILFSHLKTHPQIDRLPAADVPPQIRNVNPVFRSQPLMRLHWDDHFLILIGDYHLGLGCKMPYPGWKNFKPHILELIEVLQRNQVAEKIERYSLKYVGVIAGKDLSEQIGRIKLNLQFGDYSLDYSLREEPFTIRVEMKRDALLHIVQLGAPTTVTQMDGRQLATGLLIDIDSICEQNTSDITKFVAELPDGLEDIHTRNKEIFFGLLTPETLAYLEPSYEPVSD